MSKDADELEHFLAEQLREQVGNLMAASQLLAPVIREQENRHYDQYMAILNQSLYRLLHLAEHADLARRERRGDKLELHPVLLELEPLCRELCQKVTGASAPLHVDFRWEWDGREAAVLGDPVLLRRMLLNLMANALHAVGNGGQAGLRLSTEGRNVRLTVWNSGEDTALPGPKSPEILGDWEEGSGIKTRLGVDLAREVAECHEGRLVFEQGERRGLRAVVSLPVADETEATALRTPRMGYDPTGGFSQMLVELSDVLPFEAYLPEDVE